MSKLKDVKASLKELEILGLPISNEQRMLLVKAEDEYVDEELIPEIKELLKAIFREIDFKTKLVIDYDGYNEENINVYQQEDLAAQSKEVVVRNQKHRKTHARMNTLFLRLTYPDGRQKTGKGVDILKEFVNTVGPARIHDLDIHTRGVLLVEDHYVGGLERYQKPVNDGYLLMVNTSNQQKKKEIDDISRLLQLNYKVEIVDEKGQNQN